MISVIIPMYNASKYIVSCIEGLLSQSDVEMEILVVDDVSTDGSYDLCEKAFGDDKRVRLFKQERNGGPGAARNKGLDMAKGDYVTFVDADDALLPGALKAMEQAAVENDADLVYSGGVSISFDREYQDKLWKTPEDKRIKLKLDGVDEKEVTLATNSKKEIIEAYMSYSFSWTVWGNLYRLEMIRKNDIRFGNLRLAEDQMFFTTCLLKAERVVRMPAFYYVYRTGITSLSRDKYSVSYLIRILRTFFSLPFEVERMCCQIEFFSNNSEYVTKLSEFMVTYIESHHLSACLRGLRGEKNEIIKAPELEELFGEFFGQNSWMAKRVFFKAYEKLFEENTGDEEEPDINTLEFWEELALSKGTDSAIMLPGA